MKKINKLLILLLVLCVPFAVKADMGAPWIREYKATVINQNGVDYYDWEWDSDKQESKYVKKGHFDAGTTLYVTYEETNDVLKEKLLTVELSESSNDRYYIKGNDINSIQPVEKEFIPTKSNLKDIGVVNDVNIKALTTTEVTMYKGPSVAYESVGTIPKNTEISYKYGIGGEEDVVYIYVEYNGKKGWVNILEKKVLLAYGDEVVTFADIDTKCGKIDAGTIFQYKYRTDAWSGDIVYEKNGCTDYIHYRKSEIVSPISTEDYGYSNYAKQEITLYSKPGNKGEKITTIKKGKEFKILAIGGDEESEYGDYYINYNGTTGFAYMNYYDYESKKRDGSDTTTTTVATTEETTEEPTTEETTEANGEVEPTKNNGATKIRNTIIISVVVGVALAATAVVVIVLVNKKKKVAPAEEVKAPVEPETVMTENDLNLVKEKEDSKEETPAPDTKEDNGEE